jgi:hypothetical protein
MRGDRRARQNKSSGSVQRTENVAFPRSFASNVRFSHHFRFTSVGTPTVYGVNRTLLLNLLGLATTTTQVGRLFAGIKLNRVEVFGVSGAGTTGLTASTVSVEWLSNLGPSSEKSDTGNVFNPAHVVTSPPPQCLASFWSISGSSESELLMNVVCPSGGIVDIWVDIVLNDGETPVLVTSSTTLVVGATYAGFLSGSAEGAAALEPVSYEMYST